MGSKFVASILVFLMLASVLPIMLTSTLSAPPAPTPPTMAFSPEIFENVLYGQSDSWNDTNYEPSYWKQYEKGDNPPIMVAREVGSGRVVAAGIVQSLREHSSGGRVEGGGLIQLMNAVFQWLKPDNTAPIEVLWYEGHNVYNDATKCEGIIGYLETYYGYVITGDSAEPITSGLLADYDVVVIPQLQPPESPAGGGGDPSLIAQSEVDAVTSFVQGGGGLFVAEGSDFSGHCYEKMQNKFLEALDFGMYFQDDTLDSDSANFGVFNLDINTGSVIGAASGWTTLKNYSPCTLAEPAVAAVNVSIWPRFRSGGTGTEVTFEVTATNVGPETDSYALSVETTSGSNWEPTISPGTLNGIESDQSGTATVTVTIQGTEIGQTSSMKVTVASDGGAETREVSMEAIVAGILGSTVVGEWVQVSNSPVILDYAVGVEGAGENLYFANSNQPAANINYFMRYNPVTGVWEDLSLPPHNFKNSGRLLAWDNGNYIYSVFGGSYGDAEKRERHDFARYDISNDSWETLPDTAFWQGTGSALTCVKLGTDEYIYAVLGTSSSSVGYPSGSYTPTNVQFWRFNVAENQWDQRLYDIPYGADDGTNLVWTYGDYIYAFPGAYTEGLDKEDERYFVRYSISENTWVEMEKVPYNATGGVDDGGSLVYPGGDYIYALKGGNDPPGGSVPAKNFWRYSILDDSWDILPDLPAGIGEQNGCRLGFADGNLYYWVGPNNAYTVPEDDLYVYGLTVAPPTPFAVEVSISPTDNTGAPGTTLEYTVTVTNEGDNNDAYTLENVDDAGWTLSLDPESLTIAAGASDTATLTVTIPDNAENSQVDNITVTATSQENAEIKDNATCTATVITVPGYGVEVSISPSSKSGESGDNLNYTVTVQNTGNTDDNYDLTVADNASPSWAPSLDNTTLGVAAGENKTTTLRVTIPDNAATGDVDEITVTATSATESTVSDSTTCTATVALAYGVEVSISPSARTRLPGDELTYTVTVGNTGGAEDTFSLAVTDNASWTPSIDPWSLTIAAGASGTATLTVTIPDDADNGDVDSITVTATSATDSTVSDSATCTATVVFEYEVLISFIPAGENRVANFENENILVLEVKIIVENSEGDLTGTVTVTVLENIEGPVPPGMVHRYLKIETSIAQANIKSLTARFKVSKSWVAQNGIDEGTIRMFENTENSWLELPTERIVDLDDDEFLYFEAESQGLSLFAITGGTRGEAGGVPILLIALAVTAASAGGAAAAILWYRPKLPPTPKLPSLRRVRTRLPRIGPRRQIQLRLPEGIVEDIDKWVKERRFRSRADAIRTILATYHERERTRDFYKMLAKRSGEAKKKSMSLAAYDERERTHDFYNMLAERSSEAKKKSKSLATYQERERTRDFYKMLTKRSREAKKKSKSLAPLEED